MGVVDVIGVFGLCYCSVFCCVGCDGLVVGVICVCVWVVLFGCFRVWVFKVWFGVYCGLSVWFMVAIAGFCLFGFIIVLFGIYYLFGIWLINFIVLY